MFDLSFSELLLIALLAVLLIGPRELPAVLRAAGRGWRSLRGIGGEFRQILEESGREIMEEAPRQAGSTGFIRDDQGRLQQVYDISEFMDNDDRAGDASPPQQN